jgi:hypothetical protein
LFFYEFLKNFKVCRNKDFGAIEFGLHKFHNNQEQKSSKSNIGRFFIVCEHANNEWKNLKGN